MTDALRVITLGLCTALAQQTPQLKVLGFESPADAVTGGP